MGASLWQFMGLQSRTRTVGNVPAAGFQLPVDTASPNLGFQPTAAGGMMCAAAAEAGCWV